ncbi:MAG: toll/interleukin-1 receptor domain-containing protein [Rhodospirillales bacterium]
MAYTAPRVFISYSHDDDPHKKWVLHLATQLRLKGVDAVLDQWDLKPGKDVTLFMEEQLSGCNYAILVCTARYVEKANNGKGGVGYERMIVSSELVKDIDAGKFIPIVREGGSEAVPKFIETKLWLDFTNDEYFESVFDDLLRAIFGAEISSKPPLGTAPDFSSGGDDQMPAAKSVARSKSSLSVEAFEIFQVLIKSYDQGDASDWKVRVIADAMSFGRVTTDAAIIELVDAGYVEYYRDIDLVELKDKGKIFARRIGLV